MDRRLPRELVMFSHRRWMAAWAAVGVLHLASGAWADLIVLKGGREVQGKIVSQTDKVVKVKIKKYGVTVTRSFRRDEIKSILKDAEAAARKAKAAGEAPDRASQADRPTEKDEPSATKPATDKDKVDDRTPSAPRESVPVEIDLRMALTTPLIRDTFEASREKVEPFGRGYFLLVPFRYEAGDRPYAITRQTIRFKADRGSARVRGFVPLEARADGARRSGPSARSAGDYEGEQDEEISLQVVKGRPLYVKMTVYQDQGDLMVSFLEGPKTASDRDQVSGESRRRSSRGTGSGRRSRGSRGRRSRGSGSGRSTDSVRGGRGSEKRGYEKRGYEKPKDEGRDDQREATESKPDYAEKAYRGKRQPKKGEPASGWAALLVELANEAAVVTALGGPEGKVPIELRLIDALAKPTGGRARNRESEDELEKVEAVADYATHKSPAMSRLAVAKLVELRGSRGSRGASRGGAEGEEGTIDERTRLIETALLNAVASQDERTRRIAWWEITSTDALPDSTEMLIAGLECTEVAEALFKLAKTDIKNAAKTPVSGSPAAPKRRARSAARRPPPPRGQKQGKGVSYTPVGLPESAAAQGVWNVLGALMRVTDDKAAMRAMSLVLQDGSRQAIALLGQPYVNVVLRASMATAKAPNTPTKHQALRMILSGLANNEEGQDVEAVSALSQVAKSMAQAGDPPRVADAEDLLIAVVPAKRDDPKQQLAALGLLEWCAMDPVMETPGMENWLNDMTDDLVAQECQAATYQLIAGKWRPSSLGPLTKPDKAQDAAPEGGKPTDPAAARRGLVPRAATRTPGRSGRSESQGVIEKFLLAGLVSRPEPRVQVAIITALLRAGHDRLILEQLQSAEPKTCVGLIKVVRQLTAQGPPSLVPGTPSRFTPLGLVMGLAGKHKDPAVRAETAATLNELLEAAGGQDLWRLALAFKRRLQWGALSDLCSAVDTRVAGRARKVVGGILDLAKGEQTGIDTARNRQALSRKFGDYDQQRGGKIAGKYQGLVLCELLVPSYTLQFEATSDGKSKERTAQIVNLSWSRRVIGLEPGLFEVVVNKDRKIEVKLGGAVVGTGEAPTPKATQPAGKQPLMPGAKDMPPAAAKRLAQLRRTRQARRGSAADEQTPEPFAIQLSKLMAAVAAMPSMRDKVPAMTLSTPAGPARPRPGAGAKPGDPLSCPMGHLAFGTRQGSLRPGDGKPPSFDNLEVRVDAAGRIIRGVQPVPILQEIQIFLEPVPGHSAGG